MKKLLLILSSLMFLPLYAETYWVTPRGNNANAGTDSSSTGAWLTWGKAFNATEVSSGDTVLFRGGIYYKTLTEDPSYYWTDGKGAYKMVKSGINGNWIYFWAYPADYEAGNPPILDCINIIATGNQHHAIRWSGNYIHWKGLTIRNVRSVETGYVRPEKTSSGSIAYNYIYEIEVASVIYNSITYNIGERFTGVSGVTTYTGSGEAHKVESVECFGWEGGGSNVIVENCTFYNIHGIGFRSGYTSNQIFKNCDAYECCDSFAIYPQSFGQRGTGYSVQNISAGYTATLYYEHCRAWHCSDQGFSCNSDGLAQYDGCWSFDNGLPTSQGGIGFKLTWWERETSPSEIKRRAINCIAAYNLEWGFTTNDTGEPNVCGHEYFNNLAYANGGPADPNGGHGFIIYNTNDTEAHELYRAFRNNISFANEVAAIYIASGASYTHSNNSWDGGATITATDFLALPATNEAGITLLSAVRGIDGSMPSLGNNFQLATGSDAIGAGIDVGLIYDCNDNLWESPPSIGAFEYNSDPPIMVISITISAAGSATTITVEDGTLQLYTNVEPDNATDTTKIWSITNGTGEATISIIGLVTAVTDGTVTAKATANDGSGIYDDYLITISNQNPPPGIGLPTVYSMSFESWTAIWVITGGNVADDGGGTVSARGMCWSTSANPTIADSHTTDGTGEGAFVSIITGLKGNTSYHVRAYATNEEGTAYGADIGMTTPRFSVLNYGKRIRYNGKFIMTSR